VKTLVFQHTPDETPGSLETWLQDNGYSYHIHHWYRATPPPEDFDSLVVLGGPMNVDQEERHPWLKAEKKFLHHWLEAHKPVLGICLGGQMLAQCLGGEVTKNKEREIGFHAVTRTAGEHPALRRWPLISPQFHWHEDRFSLPPGCTSLLTSEACAHQAFARDRRTVGLQFHPEAVERWILQCYGNLVERPGERHVLSRKESMDLMPHLLPAMTRQFYHFLEDFTENAR
jgi:GMP synthase-like glutamine amidotransferase